MSRPIKARASTVTGLSPAATTWLKKIRYQPKGNVNVVYGPTDLDAQHADTTYTNGVATIKLPVGSENPAIFAHELGHAFDDENLDGRARARFSALTGMKYDARHPWLGAPGTVSAGEGFAEMYRILAQHPQVVSKRGYEHWKLNHAMLYNLRDPSLRQFRRVYQLVRQYGQ